MPVIQINTKEIVHTSSSPQKVSPNGQISIGRKNAGKNVLVYVVEAE